MDCHNCKGNGELEYLRVSKDEVHEGIQPELAFQVEVTTCPRCNGSGFLEV